MLSDPLLEGIDTTPEKSNEITNTDPLLSGVENKEPIESHAVSSDPLLEGVTESHITNTLEENKLYGEGTPFYNIAKTVGKAVLDSPIGPGIKSVLGITVSGYNKVIQEQKIGEIQFQQQTHDPTFEYYANAGIRATLGALVSNPKKAVDLVSAPASTLLNEAEFIPEHFNLPDAAKYSPAFIGLAKLSGGDLNKVNEKMMLGIGVDTMYFSGLGHLGEFIDKTGIESLKNAQALDDAGRLMLDKDLAAAKNANIPPELVTENNFGGATKGVLDDAEIDAAKRHYDMFTVEPQPELTPAELLEKVDNSQFVYNDIVYKQSISSNGKKLSLSVLRRATDIDKANYLYKDAALVATDKMGKDITSIYDFLPKEGEIDISPERYTKYGPAAMVMSPQTYAPVLFEQIGALERSRARFVDSMFKDLYSFWKEGSEESANKVFRYTDFPWKIEHTEDPIFKKALQKGFEDLSQTMTPYELKWAETRRGVFAKIADTLGIPKRDDYITHIFEDYNNGKYVPSTELSLNKNTGDRYLKERLGLPGYLENAKKTDQMYADWAAKRFLDDDHKTSMLKTIEKMKAIDPFSGNLAHMYYHNYFGDINKEIPAWRDIKDLMNKIAIYPTSAWLTANPNPSLLNLGQAIVGGSAQIGYGPMARGIKYSLQAMYGKSEESLAWKKILFDGAVLMNKSMSVLSPTKTFWEKIPGVGKLFIAAKYPLQWAENFGKAAIYLGGYEDTFNKIKATNLGIKDWTKWFAQHGIDSSKDGGTEAFKYGRMAAYNAHQDWTKAGQTTLQQLPVINIFARFAQAPYKITEFTTKNALGMAYNVFAKALPDVMKGDFNSAGVALRNPSVKTALRLGINYTAVIMASKAAGIDPSRFLWETLRIDKHTGRLVSFFIDGFKKMIDEGEKKDPKFFKDTAKYIATLSGFPLVNAGGKIMQLMAISNDPVNVNRNDGKVFVRSPNNPNSGFYTDWGHIWMDLLTPAADVNKVKHYEQLKENYILVNQIINSRKSERIAVFNGDMKRKQELVKQRIKNQIEQRKLKQKILQNSRGL